MSNRLFQVLELFQQLGPSKFMTRDKARSLDQRSFGACVHFRQWIEYVKGRGFHITDTGMKAHAAWSNTNVFREEPARRFASVLHDIPDLRGIFKPDAEPRKRKKPTTKDNVVNMGTTRAAG